MTKKILFGVGLFSLIFSFTVPALAQKIIPEPLKPWADWVLRGKEEELCPFLDGEEGETFCHSFSPLILSLEENQGSFSFRARVFAEGWLPLPGDEDHWPQEVKVGGKVLPIVAYDERPHVFVGPGDYVVEGGFYWESLPDSFAIPKEMGIVRLSVNKEPVEKIKRDEQGRLWMEGQAVDESERDRISMRVHRLLTDDIPFVMTTRMTLEVSGKTRDVVLPSPLLKDFMGMSLESPLPAQIEKDGRIKVQVKPGTWVLEFKARHDGPVQRIALEHQMLQDPGDLEEEIWAFESRNDLRLVNIAEVSSVDPTQTTLPEQWKIFPAYRIRPGETMVFEEKRRGDSDSSPDRLTLNREAWLDFDGKGYTFRDYIRGTMKGGARLEILAPIKLGRASAPGPNGFQDQLITTLGNEKVGVEIRQEQVSVTAESRLEEAVRNLPATGWDHPFQSVSQTLHLPPGWRAFGAWGADSVPNTWLNQWTLLDIFLVVIIAISFFKLCGKTWGLVALLGLALTATEEGAPLWTWVAVLVGLALLRFLSEGKLRNLVRFYYGVSFLFLIIFAVPFLIGQVRAGLYPSLDRGGSLFETISFPAAQRQVYLEGQAYPTDLSAVSPPPAPMEAEGYFNDADSNLERPASVPMVQQEVVGGVKKMGKEKQWSRSSSAQSVLTQYRPGAKVQTGPGLPEWDWRRVDIRWNGPVQKGEQIRLVLLPPVINLILSFLRVFFVAALLVCVLDLKDLERRKKSSPSGGGDPAEGQMKTAVIVLVCFLTTTFLMSPPARAEFPSQELLKELQERLLERAECYPDCASISRMKIEATPTSLTARLEIHMMETSAVPLPGIAKEWTPTEVMMSAETVPQKTGKKPEKPAVKTTSSSLTRTDDGLLWIVLEPGVHQVTLRGPLPDRQNVQIPLPLHPGYVNVEADGWSVLGLNENGIAEENIQLVRIQNTAEAAPAQKETLSLPPLLRIERRLILGLTWEVETRVVRETPLGSAVLVSVPLLAGESVTTPGWNVEEGKVLVNLSPQATETSWRSVLLESPMIPLKASESTEWNEVWVVEASPIWNVEMNGISVVRHYQNGEWLPTFRPWPGEEVTLHILRPEPVEGKTLTIERSRLLLTPGYRSTESYLSLSLRSSLGGQHTVTLPEKAELQSVEIGGRLQPIRQMGRTVAFPVVPGAQQVALRWMEPLKIGTFFKASDVDLGVPSVNAEIRLNLPERWLLFAGGPRLGPAVLFWGVIAVLFLVSIGLGRVSWTPLKMRHWFLLGLGLTQVPIWSSIFVALWLLALGRRRQKEIDGTFLFNLRQFFLVGLTVAALAVLIFSIKRGLLGVPDMQIAGNGSSDFLLIWFQDRIMNTLPQPWVVTLPMYVYRISMLAWAVWLALSLLKWLKWGWGCFTENGVWKAFRK